MSKEEENNDSGGLPRLREYEGELHIHVHNQDLPDQGGDEIDLTELLRVLWNDRIKLAKIIGVFAVLGMAIALLSPREYQASAKLMSENPSSGGQVSNLLQQYSSLLGGGGGSSRRLSEGVIPPDVYPQVIESIPFQLQLMSVPVKFASRDTTVTLKEYYNDIYSPSALDYIKKYTYGIAYKYTIGLPNTLNNLFSGSQTQSQTEGNGLSSFHRDSIYVLTSAEKKAIGQLRSRLSIKQDQETGIISFQVGMPDARAAAEVQREAIRLLRDHIRDYKTRKAKENVAFIEGMVERAEKRFNEAQSTLANFIDSNVMLSTAKARTKEQELQSEYQLAFSLYNSLNQQLEQARIRVQEDTPVFSVLQPVTEPSSPSKPNRPLIVIISLFLGFAAGLTWIISRYLGRGMVDEIKRSNIKEGATSV